MRSDSAYEFRPGGILINSLPKNRASNEKAPGPSTAAAAAVNADIASWNPFGTGAVTRRINSMRQDRAAQYGVRNPKNRHNPTSTANASIGAAQIGIERLQVSTIIVIATTERKTIRATPAKPAGKKEKSLCTVRR